MKATKPRPKRKSKPKTKTSAQLKQDCYKAIQKLARLAASDDDGYCTCVSCGTSKFYKDMQGGHWLSKGSCSYYALDITNVHPQCASCNMWGMRYGSAAQQYTIWMQDMYGADHVKEMLANKSKPVKRYKADYEEMLAEFNELIAFHEKRIKV